MDSKNDEFKKLNIEMTQLKSVILMFTAFKHFCKLIEVEYPDENIFRDIAGIVLDLSTTKEIDDTQRATEALASFVAGHKQYFVSENKYSAEHPETDAVAFETYGKIFDNGEVAFLPTNSSRFLKMNWDSPVPKNLSRNELTKKNYAVRITATPTKSESTISPSGLIALRRSF